MARDKIDVQYPILNHTESIANVKIETTKINPKNGITIHNCYMNWNKNTFIHIINFGETSILTVKAGNSYPNSMLGDIQIEIPNGINAMNLYDLSRFVTNDYDLNLDFEEKFDGAIYVVAQWNGVSERKER